MLTAPRTKRRSAASQVKHLRRMLRRLRSAMRKMVERMATKNQGLLVC